ncbi:hypothetical protein CBL_01247 [Carabus blaptoides fortunei]
MNLEIIFQNKINRSREFSAHLETNRNKVSEKSEKYVYVSLEWIYQFTRRIAMLPNLRVFEIIGTASNEHVGRTLCLQNQRHQRTNTRTNTDVDRPTLANPATENKLDVIQAVLWRNADADIQWTQVDHHNKQQHTPTQQNVTSV